MIGRICGTGSYIPSHRMDNVELSSLVDTSDEWIRERTGIQSRHLAKQETVSFMAAKAAEEALADSGLKAEEIDLILVATSSSETVFPNTSCEVQKAIGAVHAWGYDLNAACSGFILALNTAQSYIRSGLVKDCTGDRCREDEQNCRLERPWNLHFIRRRCRCSGSPGRRK